MTLNERAAQLWPLLTFCARQRQTLTYGLAAKLIGVHQAGLGKILNRIHAYCLLKQLPILAALVVQPDSGVPGEGFTAAADVPRAQARVFAHDWLQEPVPDPTALANAGELPSGN